MLIEIEEMKYFLRSAYGDSKNLLAVQLGSIFKDSVKVAAQLRQGGQSLQAQLYVHKKK